MSVVVSGTEDHEEQDALVVASGVQEEQEAAPLFTTEELEALEESFANKAMKRLGGINEDRFGLGELAFELDQQVRKGAKRAPDKYDAYRNLAAKLKRRGLHRISASRLRAYAWAYRVRTELGGKTKAPDLPIDHYVEVNHGELDRKDQRELLGIAAEKKLSATALRRFVKIRLGKAGEDAPDADNWPSRIEADISKVVSIVAKSFCIAEDQGYDLPQYTRDRLLHTAILITMFSRNAPKPTGKDGSDE